MIYLRSFPLGCSGCRHLIVYSYWSADVLNCRQNTRNSRGGLKLKDWRSSINDINVQAILFSNDLHTTLMYILILQKLLITYFVYKSISNLSLANFRVWAVAFWREQRLPIQWQRPPWPAAACTVQTRPGQTAWDCCLQQFARCCWHWNKRS